MASVPLQGPCLSTGLSRFPLKCLSHCGSESGISQAGFQCLLLIQQVLISLLVEGLISTLTAADHLGSGVFAEGGVTVAISEISQQ